MVVVQIISFVQIKNEFPKNLAVIYDCNSVFKASFCITFINKSQMAQIKSLTLVRLKKYTVIGPEEIVYIHDFDFLGDAKTLLLKVGTKEFGLNQGDDK